MKSRQACNLFSSIVLTAIAGSNAAAVQLPIVNPGFDATVVGAGFIYEEVLYSEGNPMPDHTFITDASIDGGTGHNSDGDFMSGLGDSATGANIPGALVMLSGFVGTPGTGLVHDTRDYLPGQGPDGPGGLISYGDTAPRGIFQTLVGTPFQPNTTYTFTAEVSDRRFGPSDNVSFPSGGAVVPTGVHLSLAGANGEQGVGTPPLNPGTLTFTPPQPGGTSLATLVYTTGPTGTVGDLTGDITLIIRAQGFAGLAATQVIFDNLVLDATPAAAANADFDDDNDVDGADFLIWQRGLGVGTTQPEGDANFSGGVDGTDLALWTSAFGTPQAVSAISAVPEPTSGLICCVLLGLAVTRRRQRRELSTIQVN